MEEEVPLGRAFPLTVVRVTETGGPAEAWTDDRLAPLFTRLLDTEVREGDGRTEEIRRYRAYAFAPGEVQVLDRTLRVHRTLDPDEPGAPELPGELGREREPWWALVAGLAAVLLLSAVAVVRRRRRSPEEPLAPPPAPPPPAPHESALLRIQALRGADPSGEREIEQWHLEASGLLRDYLAARFRLPARERTTEQCLSAPALPGPARARLASALSACDLVKFAGRESDAASRRRILDDGEAFVRETAPAAGEGR
jgi:hypothetical protein